MTNADNNGAAGWTERDGSSRLDLIDQLTAAQLHRESAATRTTHIEEAAKLEAAERDVAGVLLAGAMQGAKRAHVAKLAELREVERTRAWLAAERLEIEQVLIRRRHEDGDDVGWLEAANLAAKLYLDELDDSLAELRDRLAALERAGHRLAARGNALSIESARPIPIAAPAAGV